MNLWSIEVKSSKASKNWDPKPEYQSQETFELMESNFDSLKKFFYFRKGKISEDIESDIRRLEKVMEMNLFHLEHNRLNDKVPLNKKKEMAEQINLLLKEIETYLSQNYPAQNF